VPGKPQLICRRGHDDWVADSDGWRHCGTCKRENLKRWHAANRDRSRAIARRTYEKRIVAKLLYVAKGRARREGVSFDLVEADVVIPVACPILGIPIAVSEGKGGMDNSPSLDRLVPELGYVPGNVEVVSFRANTIKNRGTAAEHRAIADWMDCRGV
jgi:hypothetical protein